MNPIHRMKLVRAARIAPLLALLGITGCDLGTSTVEFDGLPLGPGPHVLLDDHLFESMNGVERRVESPSRATPFPNPVVTGEEDGNFTPYLSVLREADGRFRMWYNTPYDLSGSDRSLLGYLESSDGIRWERPHRVLPDVPGEMRFGASVIADPKGPGYLLGYHQSGGFKVAASADGFDWMPIRPGALIEHNHDIAGLTWDRLRQRYIAVISMMRFREIGGISRPHSRQTLLSSSTDLVSWETPWNVLVPDGRDHLETQFYGIDGFITRGDLMIGMVKVLREDLDTEEVVPPRGIGYTTLAWSHDGREWIRDRDVYLAPNPQPGSWDHAFAWVDDQLPVGDSVYLYYGGYETGHRGDRRGERHIGLLTIPRDRYVGWHAEAEGVIRTRPLRLEGSGVKLNVDARGGRVAVRLLDPESFEELSACAPITTDSLDAPLVCDPAIGSIGGAVRLEIAMEGARLFALEVEP